jgi:hypothetical protein
MKTGSAFAVIDPENSCVDSGIIDFPLCRDCAEMELLDYPNATIRPIYPVEHNRQDHCPHCGRFVTGHPKRPKIFTASTGQRYTGFGNRYDYVP